MLEPEPEPEPPAAPADEWTVVQRKPAKPGKKEKKGRGKGHIGGHSQQEHGSAAGVSPDAVLTSRADLAADASGEQQVQRAFTQMQHATDSVRHQPHCRAGRACAR